jgi:hypothetical protein
MKSLALGVALALFALIACANDKRVEAPVVDLAIPPLDASTAYQIAPATEPRRETPSSGGSMTGRWEGIGTQGDGLTWPMVVTMTTTGVGLCATVDYPSIPCQAEWHCTRESQGGKVEALERLTGDSARRCIDNGTMWMRLGGDDTLIWNWSGQGETATATLRRSH